MGGRMNNSIDWYAIVDAIGDDKDVEQLVTMPAASRLLLMELATAFYDRYNRSGLAEPQEMYEYLSIAQKALAREELPMNSIDYAFGTGINLLKQFPGIVAIWPMTLTDNTGRCGDASGNGFHLLQSYGITAVGFDYDETTNDVPMGVFLNNSTHLYYPDGNPFDIRASGLFQGLAPGLTIGAWVKKENVQSDAQYIVDKGGATGYVLYFLPNTRTPRVAIGGTPNFGLNGSTIDANNWHHISGRFTPGLDLAIFVDGVKTSTVRTETVIPVNDSTFRLGGNNLNANLSQAFVSMSAVPDRHILRYYNQTKAAFNG